MADILAVGAHPDDVEIAIGGTLVKMKALGYSITLCHCTDGEPTPNGSRETRLAEAAEAATMLHAELEILDMPNRYLFESVENRIKLADVIRRHRPKLLLCPYNGGVHPDHRAVSLIADGARFYAKLTRHDPAGKPWKLDPWWTTDEYRRKMEVLACYKSQFNVDMDNLASMDLWGPLIARRYGEAFFSRTVIGLKDLFDILQRPSSGTKKLITSNKPQKDD